MTRRPPSAKSICPAQTIPRPPLWAGECLAINALAINGRIRLSATMPAKESWWVSTVFMVSWFCLSIQEHLHQGAQEMTGSSKDSP